MDEGMHPPGAGRRLAAWSLIRHSSFVIRHSSFVIRHSAASAPHPCPFTPNLTRWPGFPVRILALQLKRIGDLVLTTPALHALRAAGHHVTLALTPTTAALLPALGGSVDDALVYRRAGSGAFWRGLFAGPRFDAAVDFTGRDRSALLTLASRSPRRIIARPLLRGSFWRRWVYNQPVDTSIRSRHTVDFYLDELAPLGLPVDFTGEPASPVLHLPAEVITRAAALVPDRPFIVVHPGTARSEKYWVPERWAEVICFCQRDLGLPVVLTGGKNDPFEDEHLARLRAALPTSAFPLPTSDLSGRLDLLTLAAVLARAVLVLGVDSGPMHLAAAFRRPQIVLFGPTNPFHWRPRHALARVLRAGHGDAPLTAFADRSPGGPTDAISTRAVIACISQMPPVAALP